MKYLSALFFLVLLSSCGGGNTSPETKDPDSVKVEEGPQNLADKIKAECLALKPFQFCPRGLDFIQLGDSLTWKTFLVPGSIQKDTVYEEPLGGSDGKETVDWNASIFRFEDGKILLESDFDQDRFLNRVQIETARYSTPSGIRVGMSFGELEKLEPAMVLKSFPEYNLVEVVIPTGLILHFKNNGYFDSSKKEAVAIPQDKIEKSEKVMRIVIM